MSAAWYNEIDPYAAEWLRNLIGAGLIAPGDVDERSIADVQPADLEGYAQCHFFAGVGVWSYALRLAGWPDDRPVWTGSCPCQPFSVAGLGRGTDDARHLWPEWYRLIRECRPATVFGEQVAGSAGRSWLDLVSTDLEASDYAVGAVDLPACSVGAPHIRQRLWFVADGLGVAQGDTIEPGLEGHAGDGRDGDGPGRDGADSDRPVGAAGAPGGGLGNPAGTRRISEGQRPEGEARDEAWVRGPERGCPVHPWADLEWLWCRDGKWRPTQPGLQPLAHGATARVGRLRAYGNAIVAQVAAEVIGAFMGPVVQTPDRKADG